MSCKVENLEKNMAKLTIEVSAEEFEAALEKAYQKNNSLLPPLHAEQVLCRFP